ncbi:ATP-binding cassette domain-containing protein [Pontiella sulfatireligans]|uniref:Oligopeptide transport ATP-binding protein OppF n=1 Tax=Pontiella sulfatireligans TaxID=2750658 RepID=A0A6C2UUU6_9BACT|nr:ATP-binding cassette domain-containing protein [Pontiella sulfatireligans]VGO22934.1 Oligopeptide transport ATP-binding protein OppF [Pontiella sulfatireligans]
MKQLLTVEKLNVIYGHGKDSVHAVKDVTFNIKSGEIFGLVGESGCGKSSLGKAIVRLTDPSSGKMVFNGDNVSLLKGKALKDYRQEVQMVFQDPYGSLNPRMKVGNAIVDVLEVHRIGKNKAERRERVSELFDSVGLNREWAWRYPHEFSGGQRQRICIARALALKPDLLVADEPVSALDVSVQAEILQLLGKLRTDRGLAFLFVSHDLAVVRNICDRVAVMYNGEIVEMGDVADVIDHPQHEYTRKLLSAVPSF